MAWAAKPLNSNRPSGVTEILSAGQHAGVVPLTHRFGGGHYDFSALAEPVQMVLQFACLGPAHLRIVHLQPDGGHAAVQGGLIMEEIAS